MQYIIVVERDARILKALVEAKIKLGFEPQGGVAVSWSPGSFQTWAQAMIKKEAVDTGPK